MSSPILVVDDEPLVRRLAARVLQNGGYEVVEADDGEDALRQIQCRNGEVALVLSDIKMPRMDGIELAKNVATQFPAVPTVLMSAYSYDPVPVCKSRFFVAKPFTPAALLNMVHLALWRSQNARGASAAL